MARHAEIIKNFGQSHLISSSFCLSGFYYHFLRFGLSLSSISAKYLLKQMPRTNILNAQSHVHLPCSEAQGFNDNIEKIVCSFSTASSWNRVYLAHFGPWFDNLIISRVKRLSHAAWKTLHLLNFCQHALISVDLTVAVLNVINAVYFPRVQNNQVFIAHTYMKINWLTSSRSILFKLYKKIETLTSLFS